MKKVKLALLGATGAVGSEMLKILAERDFPVSSLKLLAAPDEVGTRINWKGMDFFTEEAKPESFDGTDITLVAVGNSVSRKLSPEAAKRGSVVIDNSSAFRLDPRVPLVVPEVNPEDIKWNHGIIANPNCSTIIAVVPLYPLHKAAGIKRIIASTYQAVSGAGRMGITELEEQTRDYLDGNPLKETVFPHRIAFNIIPHIDDFQPNGYTKEELKMLNESRKILHEPGLKVNCTCARVPVFRSHSESITIETEEKLSPAMAREILGDAPGIKLVDDPAALMYPMPADSSDQDLIYVGRIREDTSAEKSMSLWVCGDQIRKGASTNAVQIAELVAKDMIL